MFLCIDSFIDSLIAGKTMENLRNQRTVDLVTSEEKLKKLAAQAFFKKFKIFNENLWLWVNVDTTYLRTIRHSGSFENADVWFLLQ